MKLIKGNLLDTECYQIAHGCNAQGVMGSGVAKAIRDEWPEVYEFYRNAYDSRGLSLGEIITVPLNNGKKIVHNCITQDKFGRSGEKFVNYGALAKCLLTISQKSDTVTERYNAVAIPEIGCGLGGGDIGILYELCADIEKMYPRMEFFVYNL